MKKVAIVILNWNGEQMLRRFLPSVLQHSENVADIVVADNASTDASLALLEKEYQRELKILGVTLPKTDKIPAVRFDRIKELAAEKYGHRIRNPFDLEPEEEVLIGRYAKEEWDSDFVFVTHYPSKKKTFLCYGRSGRSEVYTEL